MTTALHKKRDELAMQDALTAQTAKKRERIDGGPDNQTKRRKLDLQGLSHEKLASELSAFAAGGGAAASSSSVSAPSTLSRFAATICASGFEISGGDLLQWACGPRDNNLVKMDLINRGLDSSQARDFLLEEFCGVLGGQ